MSVAFSCVTGRPGRAVLHQLSASLLLFEHDSCPVRQHRIGCGPAALRSSSATFGLRWFRGETGRIEEKKEGDTVMAIHQSRSMFFSAGALLVGLLAHQHPAAARAAVPDSSENEDERKVTGTFSIVAVDPETGICGAAVASKYPAVGTVVPYVRAGVGAFCTQHWHEPKWGERALDLLARGKAARGGARRVAPRRREPRQTPTGDHRHAGPSGQPQSRPKPIRRESIGVP